jgi:voltage-gated potassium channel
MDKNINRSIKNSIFGSLLLLTLICIGVFGFMSIEHYTFIEALYMTIITVSTVGFEEVHNLSSSGMLFTIFLIVFSLGTFGFVITSITKYAIDGVFRNYYKDNKVKRTISKLENHVIICGYGRVGKQAAQELVDHNVKVVIIDNDPIEIESIKNKEELLYIQGDATSDEVIESAQIYKAQSLITTLPKDADNLFVVLSARGLCSHLKIISRASDEHSDIKLKRAGATNVIMPDKIGGQRMAKLVAQPDIVEFIETILIQKTDQVNLEEINCNILHESLLNKTISEIGIRDKSGANIIGLKREDNTYLFNPPPQTILKPTSKIFVLGNKVQINLFESLLKRGQ